MLAAPASFKRTAISQWAAGLQLTEVTSCVPRSPPRRRLRRPRGFREWFAVVTPPPAVTSRSILSRGGDLRFLSTLRPRLPLIPPPQFLLDSSVADHCPAALPALSTRDSRRSNFPATLRRVPPCAVFAQITFRPKPPAIIFAEAQRIPRKTGRGNFSRK